MIERTLLFDTQRGRLQEVEVTPAGTETITVAGRKIEAQKYRITGDLERELWYDDAGNWLQSRLEHDGAKITLTRRSVPIARACEAGSPRGRLTSIANDRGCHGAACLSPAALLLALSCSRRARSRRRPAIGTASTMRSSATSASIA